MSEEQLEALIRRHRQLLAEAAELTAEAKEIKDAIDDAIEVGWQLTVDGLTASKRDGNRAFDVTVAVTSLPKDVREACVVTRYDADLLRAAVKEAGLLESCMQPKPGTKPVLKLV